MHVRLKPNGTNLKIGEGQSRISTGDTGITGKIKESFSCAISYPVFPVEIFF